MEHITSPIVTAQMLIRYTMVLAGLKAWLEHGIELNLVRDHFLEGCPK